MKFIIQWGIWVIIFLIIIAGYAFRFELEYFFKRVVSVIVPSYTWVTDDSITISRSKDGHFYTEVFINGVKIKFLIDTGASDVALTANDAIKLRYDLSKLKYTRAYSTANGVVSAAPITLEKLQIGSKILYNIPAHISSNTKELDISLFGMAAISKFKSFKIDKDLLILSY